MVRSDNHHPSRRAVLQPDRPNADERRHLDELLDEGLRETFPASDAVAVVQQPPERMVKRRRRANVR
jgi:nicotinate phosphoribosyltransferase